VVAAVFGLLIPAKLFVGMTRFMHQSSSSLERCIMCPVRHQTLLLCTALYPSL